MLINTIENGSAIISQGMHQPVYMTTPVHTIPANLGTIGIYPNPATDYVNIDVELKSPSVFDVTMTNATGRLLWSKKYSGQIITSSCGLTEFVPGTYFITIRLKGTDIFQTFQVVKIN